MLHKKSKKCQFICRRILRDGPGGNREIRFETQDVGVTYRSTRQSARKDK